MSRFSDESGESLIELMVTIIVMAIGMTAVVAAMTTLIIGGSVHRQLARGEVVARDFGEQIKVAGIDALSVNECPTETDLDPTPTAGADAIPPAQAGANWHGEIAQVDYWIPTLTDYPNGTWANGDAPDQATAASACSNAFDDCGTGDAICSPGLVRVRYRVWNTDPDYAYGDSELTARVLVRRNNTDLTP